MERYDRDEPADPSRPADDSPEERAALARERAAWERLAESDRAYGAAFVRRAQDLSAAYLLAVQGGRGELAAFEIAGALRVSLTTAESQLTQALQITARPEVSSALTTGRLGFFHVLALLDSVSGLPPALVDQVVPEVVSSAEDLAPAEVRRLSRKVALRLDPDGAAERRVDAVTKRVFRLSPADDGMAWVRLLVQAELALRIATEAESAVAAPDDSGRTRDQRRADWAVSRLLGEAAAQGTEARPAEAAAAVLDRRHRRPTQVLVAVPVATGLGLAHEPGVLGDYGPIDAEHARSLLADAELRKMCVDSGTGNVIHVEDAVVRPVADPARVRELGGGSAAAAQAQAEAVRAALLDFVLTPSLPPAGPEPGYRPSAALTRTVKARSVRCDMVGCSQPARHCDDDHTIPYPVGTTSRENLASRSRRCHQAKQRGWTPVVTPEGDTEWISPSGLEYRRPSPHDPPPPLPAGIRLAPPRPTVNPADRPHPASRLAGDADIAVDDAWNTLRGAAEPAAEAEAAAEAPAEPPVAPGPDPPPPF